MLLRWLRHAVFVVLVLSLSGVSAAAWHFHRTLGESHAPYGFFAIVFGVAAAMLVAIWALRPSVRRAIAVGIPVYVAAVFLLITPLPLITVLLLVVVVILVGLLYWFGK